MKPITLEEAKILLGGIVYDSSIERIDNGFKFITKPEYSREQREIYITDRQIQKSIDLYGNVKNEGTQVEAMQWVSQNLWKEGYD